MARTKGHGNPNWTREETILALHLFQQLSGTVPSPKSDEVKKLSNTLRSLPYHYEAAKQPTFRNPDGVGFKLMNIRQVATGKGLANVSKIDRQIWAEYGNRKAEVDKIANAIMAGASILSSDSTLEVEDEFSEGRVLTALHLRRERHPKVRKMLLDARRITGLQCEICDISRPDLDMSLQESMFEAHHLIPLAQAGERKTILADLALLCACCHRLIHRAAILHGIWLDISRAKAMLAPVTPEEI